MEEENSAQETDKKKEEEESERAEGGESTQRDGDDDGEAGEHVDGEAGTQDEGGSSTVIQTEEVEREGDGEEDEGKGGGVGTEGEVGMEEEGRGQVGGEGETGEGEVGMGGESGPEGEGGGETEGVGGGGGETEEGGEERESEQVEGGGEEDDKKENKGDEKPGESDKETKVEPEKEAGEESVGKPETDGEAAEEAPEEKESDAPKTETEEGGQSEKKEEEAAASVEEGKENEIQDSGEMEQEQQGESEASKGLSKKEAIPENFYYDYEELVSQPYVTEESGIPLNLLKFSFSLGYDSTKRSNLHLITPEIALMCTGSMITILNLKTREQIYLRCTGPSGVGAVTVHPNKMYFAVGEKGIFPDLNIFEFPSLKLYRILKKGTERRYSFLSFSPDGSLLASQGGAPDYMLTLWNWRQEHITLRCKAFSTEVFRVTFSSDLEGHLTTAGSGHIKFWKMADTYTGLKLQGYLGKFGRTKLSDIEGYVELPDGKVVSGCEWGNLLVWDGGLIKVQITRRNNKTCHVGNIQQITLDEGEMMTIGVDGYIRVWDFETIDAADAVDDSGLFEMEPMNELKVGSMNVQLYSLEKVIDETNDYITWYAQDACGGIWNLDLTFSHTSEIPSKQFSFHSGIIEGASCSPLAHMIATTGEDNTVRIFDYVMKKQMCEVRFNNGGTSLIWLPKTLDPAGSKIIASFADGIVRSMELSQLSEEGTSRKNKNTCQLNLYQVIKPHNQKITAMCLNANCSILATGSTDCTIFFCTVNKNLIFEPIGFVKTSSPVLKLIWSPENYENETIMAVCETGPIIQFEIPKDVDSELEQTFLLSNIKTETYTFQSIKSTLKHEEEVRAQQKLEQERKEEEERLRQLRKEKGLDEESETEVKDEEQEEEEGEKDEKKEEKWIPFYPEKPSPVTCCHYSLEHEGNIWLSMGEYDVGYLYECTFHPKNFPERAISQYHPNNPITAVPIENSDGIPIMVMKFSHEGARLLLGFLNGKIRIHQLPKAYCFKELGPYWELGVHDWDYGRVTNLVVSYDNNLLLSTGADANIFVFTYMSQEKVLEKISEAKMMLPSKKEKPSVDDIEDPNAYSIEDAKQKAEYDKMLAIAQQKKEDVRIQIALLRRDFKHLLDQNELLPEYLRFSQKDFEIDSEIKVQLQRQLEEKVEEAQKKVAWVSEKHSIGLEKIRCFYKDCIEYERLVLYAFLSKHSVSSIRLAKLPDNFYKTKQDLEKAKNLARYSKESFHDSLKDAKKRNEIIDDNLVASDVNDGSITYKLRGATGERIIKALQKVEKKKKKRERRKAQWQQLYLTKPADDYEDPGDVAAIKEAQENMGDYKLKTAKDYSVPDHLRMNVHRARLHLYKLVEIVHQYSCDFNKKLLALRNEKLEILKEIAMLTEKVHDIQNEMNVSNEKMVPEVPELLPEEVPDKCMEYTPNQLNAFKRSIMKKHPSVCLGSEAKDTKVLDFTKRGSIGSFSFVRSLSTINIKFKPERVAAQENLIETSTSDVEPTPLQAALKMEEEIGRQYKRDNLLGKIETLKQNFDAKLKLLRNDKLELDVFLNYAELRQVTAFEELISLKEFEKHENVIAAKVEARILEKIEMGNKIEDCQLKIEAKKRELDKLQEREKSIHTAFQSSVGENNKYADYLNKVFKKKIKRCKKKEHEGSDEESDESSSEESDFSESDEQSESEMYDLDVCPSGCDQTLYDNTCQLREKRLDIEEENVEEKKNFETFKKDMDNLNKKAKVIQTSLDNAENDLEAFQLEKHRKLNDFVVVVSIFLHQIQHILNPKLPSDVSKVLIFREQQIENLQHRIKELQLEKGHQKKNKKEEHLKYMQLLKDQSQFEQTISELEDTCDKMMIAKFGCLIDLEILETITAHRASSELRDKTYLLEDKLRIAQEKKKSNIIHLKDELRILTQENTNLIGQMRVLFEEKDRLEITLNKRHKKLEGKTEYVPEAEELDRLKQLCDLQARDAMTLKQEIFLLSRKGGHILPPIEPPAIQTHQNA